MFIRIIPLLIAAMMVLVLSCGDSDTQKIVDPGGGPADTLITIEFADFVHFDTNSYMLMAYNYGESWGILGEWYLWWEEVFGEPFIDINSNDVYDEGVDLFFSTADSTNMDFNHNGRWDGPDDPWFPGMPFDDIDGNGVPRQGESPYQRLYDEGVPFCDFDKNGVWDSHPQFAYDMVRCSISTMSDSSIVYSHWYQDSVYFHVSDSGELYMLPPYHFYVNFFYQNKPAYYVSFAITDSGLVYTSQSLLQFHVLDTGTTVADTTVVDTAYVQDRHLSPVVFTKEVTVGERLILDGATYEGVVKVRFDNPSAAYSLFNETLWEFYFTRELGFIGIVFKPTPEGYTQRYFFHHRFDPGTIPLPMTR